MEEDYDWGFEEDYNEDDYFEDEDFDDSEEIDYYDY